MPKIDLTKIPAKTGSTYPGALAHEMDGRSVMRLGDAGGLKQFGANMVILQPGAKSSLRHWHMHEDEFVMVTQGECTLVEDGGETVLQRGECAAFPAGEPNGHHLINRTDREARFLVIGSRAKKEVAFYSDLDMKVEVSSGSYRFTRKDGSPLPEEDQ